MIRQSEIFCHITITRTVYFSPNLQLVMRDAQHLHTMISNTSDLAEKVSSKVRLLDLVKVGQIAALITIIMTVILII